MPLPSSFTQLKNDVPGNKRWGAFCRMRCFTLWISDALCGGTRSLPWYCAKFSVFKFGRAAFRLVRKGWADLISGYWIACGVGDVCPEVSLWILNNKNDLLLLSRASPWLIKLGGKQGLETDCFARGNMRAACFERSVNGWRRGQIQTEGWEVVKSFRK